MSRAEGQPVHRIRMLKRTVKYSIFIVAIALVVLGGILGSFPSQAQFIKMAFTPYYWILGQVNDADGGVITADGRKVVFFKSLDTLSVNAQDFISGNNFTLNAFLMPATLVISGDYYVAIPNDNPGNPAEGWGANPIKVNISGKGYENIGTTLTLAKGAGITDPGAPGGEPAPVIRVWFGNRLYQPQIYGADVPEDKKLPFIVKETGNLKIEVTIPDPYQLDEANSYAMEIRNPLGQTSSYNLQEAAGFKASAVATKPFVVEASYPELPMPTEGKGEYSFTFHASSKGNIASATSVTQQALVTVMGGPLRLIGTPLTFPSPYSVKAHGIVSVQYTLSNNANIEIYLISVGGERVWRKICDSGAEGGSAGTNKVAWNGTTDMGYTVGSGIYVGTIVARDEGKLLGKFKLTVIP